MKAVINQMPDILKLGINFFQPFEQHDAYCQKFHTFLQASAEVTTR